MGKSFRITTAVLFAVLTALSTGCSENESSLRIIVTTDVHGNIFSEDLLSGEMVAGSMSRVSTFAGMEGPDNVILLDNGDNLQGTPAVYYYNFEDTLSEHLWASVLNYIGYDAVTVGNHDFEAGHSVYDRIRLQYNFPMLAANAINISTGDPWFEPFTIIERDGYRVAVIGLVTPGVPGWLPEVLYEGISFGDMLESAAYWMERVEKEKPDLVVGLFHAGWNEEYGPGTAGSYLNQNASERIAREVPGFDMIFIGHDHDVLTREIINVSGDTVLMIDAGSHARYMGVADVVFKKGKGRGNHDIRGYLVRSDSIEADRRFDERFREQYNTVRDYVARGIGTLQFDLFTGDALFGDSPVMDLIHTVQLETTGADISFAAPLSFNVTIESGPLYVRDMFDLYRYENMLYSLSMQGDEIDAYLEYSYGLWSSKMSSGESRMLKYDTDSDDYRLKNRYYNFDSAEGIEYVVDLSREEGNRVTITGMTDGRPFYNDSLYAVAVNSYRGSGGGGHLESGSRIPASEIEGRIIRSTEKDLRYYMMKWIEAEGTIDIRANNNWRFIPAEWTERASDREKRALFNN
ncbi:MAG: bifunctional metallophosphatase/5'-nucleotidase [Bacteroidales bacterium]|nr:bifunctional metallophosphatase/5'-nucleotidase [Bacteroidales bacterium]